MGDYDGISVHKGRVMELRWSMIDRLWYSFIRRGWYAHGKKVQAR